MTNYNFGNIVLLQFPFTDLTTTKKHGGNALMILCDTNVTSYLSEYFK